MIAVLAEHTYNTLGFEFDRPTDRPRVKMECGKYCKEVLIDSGIYSILQRSETVLYAT